MSSPIFIAGPRNKRIRSQCIVCIKPCDEIRSFTQEQWDNFKLTALKWKDLDKFGDVCERINCENGPQNICHRNCVSYMQTSRKLEQTKNRSKKPRRLLPLLHSKKKRTFPLNEKIWRYLHHHNHHHPPLED